MLMAGDIGGTKTNIGLFDPARRAEGRDAPARLRDATYRSPDYAGLETIIEDFLGDRGASDVGGACFGVAGPVLQNRTKTPNLPWTIDGDAIARRFDLDFVILVNDLVATAEGIGTLRADELLTLNPGDPPDGPKQTGVLIAAGTGLGMAILAPVGGAWRPLPSEGGHVDFGPRDEEEIELLRFMLRRHRRVSVERVVSGPGLLAIYTFLAERRGGTVDDAVVGEQETEAPRIISERAQAGDDPLCERALEMFASLYGAEAGNLALKALATGGVYLGGGIAPQILPSLGDGVFLESFCAKGRYRPLMERIPVHVILNPEAAVLGAARRAVRELSPRR